MSDSVRKFHGMAKARGCSHAAVGNFSRLFPKCPSLTLSEQEAAAIGGPGGVMHDMDGRSPDSGIPVGYVFFAQFVDHDITLDTTSPLRVECPKSPEGVAELPNIRSASLDLDSVYGFGPEGSPHIYQGEKLAINPNGRDLARSPGGAALIGDPRNDENIFIAQLHLMFHRLHNRFYSERAYQKTITEDNWSRFEATQREIRFHYQWVVLYDFLKRICDPTIYAFAIEKLRDPEQAYPLCYKPDAHGRLTMPVEFSTAAYRVGHAMVRNDYAVNDAEQSVELFDERFGTTGFTALPEELVIDWRNLFQVEPHFQPRMAKAIDPLLADELQNLPIVSSSNPNDRALAFRNLMRASALGVPGGQSVAKLLGDKNYPISVRDLELDGIDVFTRVRSTKRKGKGKEKVETSLREDTPLFYYVLRESQLESNGAHLGPVGSALLLEVFCGMLRYCDETFIKHDGWTPDACLAKPGSTFDEERLIKDQSYYPLELADLVRFAHGRSA